MRELKKFFKEDLGVARPFLKNPVTQNGVVVDNLTAEGNAAYGNFTNKLLHLAEMFEAVCPMEEHYVENIYEIVNKLDELVNGYVEIEDVEIEDDGDVTGDTTNKLRDLVDKEYVVTLATVEKDYRNPFANLYIDNELIDGFSLDEVRWALINGKNITVMSSVPGKVSPENVGTVYTITLGDMSYIENMYDTDDYPNVDGIVSISFVGKDGVEKNDIIFEMNGLLKAVRDEMDRIQRAIVLFEQLQDEKDAEIVAEFKEISNDVEVEMLLEMSMNQKIQYAIGNCIKDCQHVDLFRDVINVTPKAEDIGSWE